jgi:transcription antitermination factor NusG
VELLLKEQNIKVFLPMIESIRIWSDRKKKIYKPLFNNYIFVKLNSKCDFDKVQRVEGVIKYVKFGNDYARIRDKEIDQIKQLLSLEAVSDIDVNQKMPVKGQRMRINYAPLGDSECEVIKVNNKFKVYVRIDSIRYNLTACLPCSYLTSCKSLEECQKTF